MFHKTKSHFYYTNQHVNFFNTIFIEKKHSMYYNSFSLFKKIRLTDQINYTKMT